jgi:hypothetical protein
MGVRTNPDNKSFEELFGSTKADAFNHAYVLSKPPEMRPLFAGLSYAENDAARNPSLRRRKARSSRNRMAACISVSASFVPPILSRSISDWRKVLFGVSGSHGHASSPVSRQAQPGTGYGRISANSYFRKRPCETAVSVVTSDDPTRQTN